MRVLVTGGGGYIGSTLVSRLLESGHEVVVLDRFFFGRERLPEHERLTTIREDIRATTAEHFRGLDAVIDLAALSNDPSGELEPEVTWQINCHGRVRNAELAKVAGVPRYVLPSSCSVYGFREGDFTADEATPINPLTTYAKANASAEDRARVWGPEYLSARHYLRIYIRQLREKLEVDPALPTLFKTEWGSGYALSTTGAGPAAARRPLASA